MMPGKAKTSYRDELPVQVAYVNNQKGEGLSQITTSIGQSVSMASRLLNEARKQNLVQIRINYPMTQLKDLEAKFEDRFGIIVARLPGSIPQTRICHGRPGQRLIVTIRTRSRVLTYLPGPVRRRAAWLVPAATAIRPRLHDLCKMG